MPENIEENLSQLAEEFQIGKSDNPDEQIKKLTQLEKLPSIQVVQALNHFVCKEINPKTLLHIIKTIGKFNDKSSAEPLVELLLWKEKFQEHHLERDEYLKVRCMVASVLGNLKSYNAVVPLLYVLNNKEENYKLRLSVAEALGRIGDKYAVAPLIEVVTNEDEKSIYLRESAAKALGMLGDIRAIDPLVTILEAKKGILDKFTFLKERAIESIGRIGFRDDRIIRVLKNSLLDESPSVRLNAIEALSEIDDDRVFDLIAPMINDSEEDVARGAICALYNVAGREYILDLLQRHDLSEWCRDEIEMILDEESEEDEEENDEE